MGFAKTLVPLLAAASTFLTILLFTKKERDSGRAVDSIAAKKTLAFIVRYIYLATHGRRAQEGRGFGEGLTRFSRRATSFTRLRSSFGSRFFSSFFFEAAFLFVC